MKKISLLIIVSVFATIVFAQQFPLQSQYQFNYPTINPAASGENDFYRARASFREQWVGLTENPISTQILTVTKGFGNNGLGITFFSDKTGGAFNKSGAALSYSHRVKINKSYFAFGVSAGASKINLTAIDDPALITTDNVIPDFTFGMYYTLGDLKLGLSIPGLIKANMDFTDSDENTLDRHFYTMISYTKKLNDDWSAHPSILVKMTSLNNQIDANINFKLRNKLWFGTSYRQDFGPTIYVGIDFGKLLSVYSFDISTNEVADYSNGSHEFTLGYDFIPDSEADKKRKEAKESNEETNDKDRDGVVDSEDLCPNEYGSGLANGCPDFDKDGIPDKFDLCPHLHGDISIQGCPELTSNETVIISKALQDLKFDFDKSVINYESFAALTDLAILMHRNPAMLLYIEGHASSEGAASYNLSLSAKRSKAVQKFFISRGLSKRRLIIDFYGEEEPLNSNDSEEKRAKNRRVEFDIKYHLYDEVSADELRTEYDSLLNMINGNNLFLQVNENIKVIVEDKNITVEEELVDTVVVEPKDTVSSEVHVDTNNERALDENAFTEQDAVAGTIEIEDANIVSKNPADGKYLVIVQVFNDVVNAVDYTSSGEDNLEYISVNDKYYVFAFSSTDREAAESFRNNYGKGCWILDPK